MPSLVKQSEAKRGGLGVTPMELGLHVAAPQQNDTFFALFNESMRACECTIYPIAPNPMPELELYAIAWMTLLLFLFIVIAAAVFLIYRLQECCSLIQEEADKITSFIRRVGPMPCDSYKLYEI